MCSMKTARSSYGKVKLESVITIIEFSPYSYKNMQHDDKLWMFFNRLKYVWKLVAQHLCCGGGPLRCSESFDQFFSMNSAHWALLGQTQMSNLRLFSALVGNLVWSSQSQQRLSGGLRWQRSNNDGISERCLEC